MPDQVSEDVKRERIERLIEVVQAVAADRNRRRIGRTEEVLVEGASRTDASLLRGRTRRNRPSTSRARRRPASSSTCGSTVRHRRLCAATRRLSPRSREQIATPVAPHARSRGVTFEPEGGWRWPRATCAARGPDGRALRADGLREVCGRRGPRGQASGRCDLGRRDAGLPRSADPHEPAGSADTARRDLAARLRGLGRRVCGISHTRRSTRRWPQAGSCRGRGNRSLPARRAGRPRVPASRLGGGAEHWEAVYDRLGARAAHAALAERDPEAASVVHANDRRRVVRALELAAAGQSLEPGESRLWSTLTRHPDRRDRPRRPARGAGRRGSRPEPGDDRAGRRGRGSRGCGASALARRPRHHRAARARRRCRSRRPIAAIETRTRRYAAYQRKWMRRIPGIVSRRRRSPSRASRR